MRMTPIFPLLLTLGCGGGEDDCEDWFCEDGKSAGDDDDDGKSNTTDGKGGKGDDDDGKGDTEYSQFSGEIDIATGLGWFYLVGADCESVLNVDEATAADDCADCDFAYFMTATSLGASQNDCEDATLYMGVPIGAGHADPGDLYVDKEGWYTDEFGISQVVDGTWDFTFTGK